MFETREKPFIKHCCLTDYNLLCGWVVELPPLVALRVANEDASLHVWGQALSLVLLDVDIGCTPPNAKMGDIWLALVPEFIGGGLGDSRGVGAIEDMSQSEYSFTPEGLRKPRFSQHSCNTISKCPVSPLSNAILLRAIASGMLPLYAMFKTEVIELIGHVLATLVIAQAPDFRASLSLHP